MSLMATTQQGLEPAGRDSHADLSHPDLSQARAPSRRNFLTSLVGLVAGAALPVAPSAQAQQRGRRGNNNPAARINPEANMSALVSRNGLRGPEGNWVSVGNHDLPGTGIPKIEEVSNGEAYHVIAHGMQQLTTQNGGQIPPKHSVWVTITIGQHVIDLPINPSNLPAKSVEMNEGWVRAGLRDPRNSQAMRAIKAELFQQNTRTGPDTLSTQFISKRPNEKASLVFKLVPSK